MTVRIGETEIRNVSVRLLLDERYLLMDMDSPAQTVGEVAAMLTGSPRIEVTSESGLRAVYLGRTLMTVKAEVIGGRVHVTATLVVEPLTEDAEARLKTALAAQEAQLKAFADALNEKEAKLDEQMEETARHAQALAEQREGLARHAALLTQQAATVRQHEDSLAQYARRLGQIDESVTAAMEQLDALGGRLAALLNGLTGGETDSGEETA